MKRTLFFILLAILKTSFAQFRVVEQKMEWEILPETIQKTQQSIFKQSFYSRGASDIRVLFQDFQIGSGNYVKVDYAFAKKPLFLTDKIVKGFDYSSPILRGQKLYLTLVIRNKKTFQKLKISKAQVRVRHPIMRPQSICEQDDRSFSEEKRMGRMMQDTKGNGGCSGGMISKSCLLTAGHCHETVDFVEFQVPASDAKGNPVPAQPEDQYAKEEVVGHEYEGMGQDWAVIRYKANPLTNKFPGDVQGFYKMNYSPIKIDDEIRITGFGTDNENPKNQTQQTDLGKLVRFSPVLYYYVDTNPGNSGTPVVHEKTDSVIGIHTNGGCNSRGEGSNKGTSLHFNVELQEAIKLCLRKEREEILRQRHQRN